MNDQLMADAIQAAVKVWANSRADTVDQISISIIYAGLLIADACTPPDVIIGEEVVPNREVERIAFNEYCRAMGYITSLDKNGNYLSMIEAIWRAWATRAGVKP